VSLQGPFLVGLLIATGIIIIIGIAAGAGRKPATQRGEGAGGVVAAPDVSGLLLAASLLLVCSLGAFFDHISHGRFLINDQSVL
jgi:hypothetical protein